MASIITRKGLKVVTPDPTGVAGLAINDNFKTLGDNTQPFTHTQAVAALTWNINHLLGRKPHVEILDTMGNVVEGSVQHVDVNNIVITFDIATAGSAELR